MKKLSVFLTLIVLIFCVTSLTCAETPIKILDVKFQFVGFSTTTSTGDGGVLKFTQMCQADYPRSRMCTSEEVMNTTNLPALTGGPGWVRPIFMIASSGYAIDASGLRGISDDQLTCEGWTRTSGWTGLVVTNQGQFSFDYSCGNSYPVACCAAGFYH